MCLIIGFEILMRSYEIVNRNTHYASFKVKRMDHQLKINLCSYKIIFHQIKKHIHFMLFHILLVKNENKTRKGLIFAAILTIPCCRGESSFSISIRARSSFPTGWLVKATSWRTTLSPREIPVMSTAFTSGPITCPYSLPFFSRR